MRARARQKVARLAAVAMAGAMMIMLWAPVRAQAATMHAGASSPVQTQRLCSLPKPGYRACMALRVVGSAAPADEVTPQTVPAQTAPAGFGPADLRSAYNLLSTGGSGVTVAIVDAYDDPDAESDLASYRSTYGLSSCTAATGCFTKVNQTGGTTYPSPDHGWAGEIALDIEMVSAACSSCHILLVEANSASNADLDAAVNYAAAHATVVSNSYGAPESSSDASDGAYNHPGVLITASSGDDGYQVEFPAASPTVLAVGGTSLTKTSSTLRGWTESVWSSSTGGAGSGCSSVETQPSWQTSSANINAVCSKRAVADVSADADPATGVAVLDTYGAGGWTVDGGTSAASPLVAAIYALTGHAGGSPSFAYSSPGDFYDVTSGQTSTCGNTLCEAGVGWDGPTGLGTPDGATMASNDFSLAAGSVSVAPGAAGGSMVTTAVTSGSPETVTLAVSGVPTGVKATVAPSSITSGASATVTVTVGSTVAVGSYTLTVTGTAASGSHTATLHLTVAHSDFSLAAGSVSVAPGATGSSTVTTSTVAGSAETVTLAVSGVPTGVKATVTPSSITSGASATVKLTVGSTVAVGSYTLTVTGTAASGSHAATLHLTVARSDFSLAAAYVSVAPGATGSSTVTTAVTSGSPETVTLAVSGAPAGVKATVAPSSITSGASATVKLAVGSTAAVGSYTLTVTGTAASGSHTAKFTLTVTGSCTTSHQLLANPGFESGSSGWTASSGVITHNASNARSGNYEAYLDGYGTTHTDTLYQSVAIPGGACTAKLSFWQKIITAESTTTKAADVLTVTVRNSSGTVLGTLATYSNLNRSAGYVQKSFDLASYAGQTVRLEFVGTEDSARATSFIIDDTALTVTR
ncbi:MAG: hypothetical protein QOI16_2362 [Pseudonocardiales bacterium]|nr:hypothetical protein [Pseudonocardiales bacterium]